MLNLPFTLRQLEVFGHVSELRSFRIAAERLGISQASVSNQIKELETQLGTQLLARSPGKRPALTPEGQAFVVDLHSFRVAAEKLSSHRQNTAASNKSARFRVLVGQGLLDRFVRPKLDDFLYRNPGTELDFVAQLPYGSAALKKLDEDCFDCALLHVIQGAPIDKRLRYLARVGGGVYGHKKFARGETRLLDPAAISELPFILPLAGTQQERWTLAALSEVGISPTNVVARTQYYSVTASMIGRGLGVASASLAMIGAEARQDVMLLHPLAGWFLVSYRRRSHSDPRLDVLEKFLTSAVLDDPAYPALRE